MISGTKLHSCRAAGAKSCTVDVWIECWVQNDDWLGEEEISDSESLFGVRKPNHSLTVPIIFTLKFMICTVFLKTQRWFSLLCPPLEHHLFLWRAFVNWITSAETVSYPSVLLLKRQDEQNIVFKTKSICFRQFSETVQSVDSVKKQFITDSI